jgi:hypothetical protein
VSARNTGTTENGSTIEKSDPKDTSANEMTELIGELLSP